MKIEIPGVDTVNGLDLCDGDEEIYLRVLRSYVIDVTEALEKIRSVSVETLKSYTVSVHGIKSTSAAIGAEELRKTAKELEDMAKSGDLNGILAKNDAFLKYTGGIVNNIREWFKKNGLKMEL